MKLNHSFLKTVLTLYDEMNENGASLVYLGEFSHEITKMFSSMAESDMLSKADDRQVKRRVYHIIVETLQNMNKHSDEISEDQSIGNGLFLIGKKNDTYYIITSNKILIERKESLKDAIDQVNEATPEDLKKMHKEQMVKGKLSDKGGAGLGLIDIARKTTEKLEYQFIPIDKKFMFFILKVEIKDKAGIV